MACYYVAMILHRRIFAAACAIVGAVVGPALYFAVANLGQGEEQWDRLFLAADLMQAYDTYNAPQGLHRTMAPDSTEQSCGYDIHELAGRESNPRIALAPGKTSAWTPLSGYDDLVAMKDGQYNFMARFERGRALASHSAFALRTLTDCIQSSALAPICSAYVRGTLSPKRYDRAWISPPVIDQTRDDRTICTYLDGLAARSGKRPAK